MASNRSQRFQHLILLRLHRFQSTLQLFNFAIHMNSFVHFDRITSSAASSPD